MSNSTPDSARSYTTGKQPAPCGLFMDFAPQKRQLRNVKAKKLKTRIKVSTGAETIKITFGNSRHSTAAHPRSVQRSTSRARTTQNSTKHSPKQSIAVVEVLNDPSSSVNPDGIDQLEEIFDELESASVAAESLFADYENPLERGRADFISEPTPLSDLIDSSESSSDDTTNEIDESVNNNPTDQHSSTSTSSVSSPFLQTIEVDKRPLSGYTSSTTTIASPASQPSEVATPNHPQPSLQKNIDMANRSSNGISLVIAILITIALGAVAGALLYFVFFADA